MRMLSRMLLVGGIGGLCVFVGIGRADEGFRVPRKEVMEFLKTVAVDPPKKPAVSPGVVWKAQVTHPSAVAAIRLHFDRKPLGASPAWRLVVRSSTGAAVETIERTSPIAAGKEFWTAAVPGSTAKVELTVEGDLNATGLVLDRYAVDTTEAKQQGTVGPDQKIPIGQANAAIQRWGHPVARLLIGTQEGALGYCTGFTLNDTLVMTNQHCIANADEARITTVEFGFDANAAQPDRYAVTALEAVDPSLDFAIVRTSGSPGTKHGHVTLDPQRAITRDLALVVVQHPSGLPKMASIADCTVKAPSLVGVGARETDFGHGCDTLPGSSGSPISDSTSGSVVGLHHLGFPPGSANPQNQGVRIAEIVTFLNASAKPIHDELGL